MNATWISPATGATLQRVAPHVLAHGHERWPVIDEIPFLRADRRELADAALDAIDAGDAARAAALLLTDQDPFAPDPPPRIADNLALLALEPHLTFRDAMARLRLGRVADYFAHRWSDPTFLSGLVLATALERAPVLELACGAGHFIPELAAAGLEPIGADLVFAKLWLCRHFIAPDATLVCFDAQRPWPIPSGALGGAFCHDAFYFLPGKQAVIGEMRRCCLADAVIARLPMGYDQMVGRWFRSGVELSGGEWQKVAIARAYMRVAQGLRLVQRAAAFYARCGSEVLERL